MTKQSDIEMVAKARAWAVKAHAGQKDKAGKNYFKAHVTVVAEGVKGDPIAEAVAFLHDAVEDTSAALIGIIIGSEKAELAWKFAGLSRLLCCRKENVRFRLLPLDGF